MKMTANHNKSDTKWFLIRSQRNASSWGKIVYAYAFLNLLTLIGHSSSTIQNDKEVPSGSDSVPVVPIQLPPPNDTNSYHYTDPYQFKTDFNKILLPFKGRLKGKGQYYFAENELDFGESQMSPMQEEDNELFMGPNSHDFEKEVRLMSKFESKKIKEKKRRKKNEFDEEEIGRNETMMEGTLEDVEGFADLSTSTSSSSRDKGKGRRPRRSVVHLYDMVVCATGCNPLAYKGYGCYCGFLGSGLTVDGIDRCCAKHDWCYHNARCPPVLHYFVPYYWTCNDGRPRCVTEYRGWKGVCGANLCECDRQFAECLRKFPCPRSRAMCVTSPWRFWQNLIMFPRRYTIHHHHHF